MARGRARHLGQPSSSGVGSGDSGLAVLVHAAAQLEAPRAPQDACTAAAALHSTLRCRSCFLPASGSNSVRRARICQAWYIRRVYTSIAHF